MSARFASLAVGAAGSVALTLYFGRNNSHYVLTALFVFWVLGPFAVLAFADWLSTRWPNPVRRAIHRLMFTLTLVSLAGYSVGAFRPLKAQPAAVFLVVPVACYLLMAIVVGIAALAVSRQPGPR